MLPGATGFRPPALSQGKTAEEDEKRLATILFAGDRVIHIDNCEQPITGDFLCSDEGLFRAISFVVRRSRTSGRWRPRRW